MSVPPSSSVSLVLTTYNHAHYLGEAIESALGQTVRAMEIIVVDDGSTDEPERVVARYAGVRMIRQENQGLSAARNTGLEAARGEFIVFLDADDRLLPRALEVNLEQFREHPECGFVYAAHLKTDATGQTRWEIPLKPIGPDPYLRTLAGNPVGMPSTVMYHRERLLGIGGFNRRFRACEDYDVFLRMGEQYRVVCLDEMIAEYRQHESNMSRDAPMMLKAALTVLRQHRAKARSRPAWWAAYRRGVREWKEYYAGEHMRHAINATSVSSKLLRQTARMVWLAPLTSWHAAMEVWRGHRRNR